MLKTCDASVVNTKAEGLLWYRTVRHYSRKMDVKFAATDLSLNFLFFQFNTLVYPLMCELAPAFAPAIFFSQLGFNEPLESF